jgi:hypothetical protein
VAIKYRMLCFGFLLVILGGIIISTFAWREDWYNLDFGSLLAILFGFLITFSGCCIVYYERCVDEFDQHWRRKEL